MNPGQRATVLVTFAVIGGTPSASNVGNVINVPPPAMALMAPAATAANATSAYSVPLKIGPLIKTGNSNSTDIRTSGCRLFFTGWLGLIVVGALFTSLGLLMSALTANQIIAAVLSLIGSLFLLFYPWIALFLPGRLPARISNHIDIVTHLRYFARGLLESGVLVYHLSLTAFFLFLAVRVIERRRWKI